MAKSLAGDLSTKTDDELKAIIKTQRTLGMILLTVDGILVVLVLVLYFTTEVQLGVVGGLTAVVFGNVAIAAMILGKAKAARNELLSRR